MPQGSLAVGAIPCQQFKSGIAGDGTGGILHGAVYFGGKNIPRQPFADAFGNIESRSSFGILTDIFIGKSDFHKLRIKIGGANIREV